MSNLMIYLKIIFKLFDYVCNRIFLAQETHQLYLNKPCKSRQFQSCQDQLVICSCQLYIAR